MFSSQRRAIARTALPALVLMTAATAACAQAAKTTQQPTTQNQRENPNQITAKRLTIRATDAGNVVAEVDGGQRLTASAIDFLSADGTLKHTLKPSQDGQLLYTYANLMTPKVQIGVTMEPVSGALASQLGLKEGQAVLLSSVTPGQAAEKAGLCKHDVVCSVNGDTPVTPKTLREVVKSSSPGDKICLDVLRAGKKLSITIEVEAYDQPKLTSTQLDYTYLTGQALRNLNVTEEVQPVITARDPEVDTTYLQRIPLLSYYLAQPDQPKQDVYSNLRMQLNPLVVDGRVSVMPELTISPVEVDALIKTRENVDLTVERIPETDVESALLAQINRLRDQLDRIEALLQRGDKD